MTTVNTAKLFLFVRQKNLESENVQILGDTSPSSKILRMGPIHIHIRVFVCVFFCCVVNITNAINV